MDKKIKLGVSSCLLGNSVRYNKGHKREDFIADFLPQFFDLVPVCPEVESGLPIPRPPMHLELKNESVRILSSDGTDLTSLLEKWIQKKIQHKTLASLSGFIFKNKSPSCGLSHISIFSEKENKAYFGSGLFAKAFTKAFPHIPVEEEGRLRNPVLREHFFEKVFLYERWKKTKMSISHLIFFHEGHKLIFMAHSPAKQKELGRILAKFNKKNLKEIFHEYETLLFQTMLVQKTIAKEVNVLSHMMGYLKKHLDSFEKQELITLIEDYRKGFVPQIVPLTLLKHYIRKYNIQYLSDQHYLNSHPVRPHLPSVF